MVAPLTTNRRVRVRTVPCHDCNCRSCARATSCCGATHDDGHFKSPRVLGAGLPDGPGDPVLLDYISPLRWVGQEPFGAGHGAPGLDVSTVHQQGVYADAHEGHDSPTEYLATRRADAMESEVRSGLGKLEMMVGLNEVTAGAPPKLSRGAGGAGDGANVQGATAPDPGDQVNGDLDCARSSSTRPGRLGPSSCPRWPPFSRCTVSPSSGRCRCWRGRPGLAATLAGSNPSARFRSCTPGSFNVSNSSDRDSGQPEVAGPDRGLDAVHQLLGFALVGAALEPDPLNLDGDPTQFLDLVLDHVEVGLDVRLRFGGQPGDVQPLLQRFADDVEFLGFGEDDPDGGRV